uniref:Glycosyltransferase 2-like domain-containing protein n=1 Tax=Brassica oleracea var. oleracea TaxID=109376 RepID=A0A0D3BZ04_BRAOL
MDSGGNSKMVVIPVTLKGANYLLWARLTKTALGGRGLWEIVEEGRGLKKKTILREDGKEIVVAEAGDKKRVQEDLMVQAVEQKIILPCYTRSEDQLADIFTKAASTKFHGEGLKASVDGVGLSMYTMWNSTRSTLIVPVFRCLVALCLIISLLVSIESVYMNLVILYVKMFDRKPEKVYKWEEMQKDMELGHQNYPVVLIQIPMYNEREVFELSIGAACRLIWPWDRLIVQVLDDSTDPDIMELISKECAKWASKDINIKYERRDNRNGYKAGALKHGMRHSYVKQCKYPARAGLPSAHYPISSPQP